MFRFSPGFWLVVCLPGVFALAGCADEVKCGDKVVGGSEQCDDGNTDETDGCLKTCVRATCGDKQVHAGEEECDDGNKIDTDECTSTCKAKACGDGFVQPGEECEDKNVDNTDVCLNNC